MFLFIRKITYKQKLDRLFITYVQKEKKSESKNII
jgi:hypothetical protein